MENIVTALLQRGIIVEKAALEIIEQREIALDEIEKLALDKGILTKEEIGNLLSKAEPKIEILKTKNIAKEMDSDVRVEKNFVLSFKEKNLSSFVDHFNFRYEKLKNILSNRIELRNAVSIGRFAKNGLSKDVTAIGMVSEVFKTKSGNTLIELEDPTGKINVLVKADRDLGQDKVLLDEVIGVKGTISKSFLFADSIIYPDVPIPQKINSIPDAVQAVFISDLHYGSRFFIEKIEKSFLEWIKSKDAARVKYLFIAGDLVDGVGIYPTQEKDLIVKDIYAQYKMFEEFLQKIPEYIQIIITPGNHDAVRIAEPQPSFSKDLLPIAYGLSNVHLVSNPAFVTIHAIDCQGIGVLLYHGTSFPSIIDTIPYLRQKGATNPSFVMKEVLRRRHLAPTYSSTTTSPEEQDWLVIDKVPDIFHTGNLHAHCVDNYKGTTLINSSTFQAQTPFMDRMGMTANPGKITIVDLQTRKVEVKDFS